MKLVRPTWALLSGVALAACSSSSSGGICGDVFSDTVGPTGTHVCFVYPHGYTGVDGNPVKACPAANQLGYCASTAKAPCGVYYYSDNGFSESDAKSLCTENGDTWTPTPT